MKLRVVLIALTPLLLANGNAFGDLSFNNPRMAVVISKTSFNLNKGMIKGASQGWTAVANLAGIPYDCLFLSDLADPKSTSGYDLIVLTQCSHVDGELYSRLLTTLTGYLAGGGNLIIDGRLAVFDDELLERNHQELDDALGLQYGGFQGDTDYRIRTADNAHYITRSFEPRQFVTQHLAGGLNVLKPADGGRVLLVSTDGADSHPFLSCRETDGNRIVMISDLATEAGVCSFFRNKQPRVFYANKMFDVLVRTVHWAIYGETERPFPVPQVSNADLTAIIRLDADGSRNLEAQRRTINYLVSLAKETGVVAVYAWVSINAAKAGWENLAPLGKKLEDAGGQIATHSKTHRVRGDMTEERWREELDESVETITENMNKHGVPVGDIDFFVNPGNTIPMDAYEQIAKRFSFYMTHGFQLNMPLGYGNLTWFTGPHKDLAVLNDVPSPDYQWFYDTDWNYTTAQITAYQEAIFDHMYDNVGRGVIYNQMWHDYGITNILEVSPQRDLKERKETGLIINESNIAHYDAVRAKFADHDIYCPGPVDLGHKLRAMARWDYSWNSEGNRVEMTLDLTGVRLDEIADHTGGMGLRMENTDRYIQKVSINDRPHHAFNERLIILPNLNKGKNNIVAHLGPHPSREPRVTFVSKRMPEINETDAGFELSLLTRNKAKFNIYCEKSFVLLNADRQEWNRKGDRILTGYVTSDRKLLLRKTSMNDFIVSRSTLPIVDYMETESTVSLTLESTETSGPEIWFQCSREPKEAALDGRRLNIIKKLNNYQVRPPEFDSRSELVITF